MKVQNSPVFVQLRQRIFAKDFPFVTHCVRQSNCVQLNFSEMPTKHDCHRLQQELKYLYQDLKWKTTDRLLLHEKSGYLHDTKNNFSNTCLFLVKVIEDHLREDCWTADLLKPTKMRFEICSTISPISNLEESSMENTHSPWATPGEQVVEVRTSIQLETTL